MTKKGKQWLIFVVLFVVGWSLSIALAYLFIRDMISLTALNLGLFLIYGESEANHSHAKGH